MILCNNYVWLKTNSWFVDDFCVSHMLSPLDTFPILLCLLSGMSVMNLIMHLVEKGNLEMV